MSNLSRNSYEETTDWDRVICTLSQTIIRKIINKSSLRLEEVTEDVPACKGGNPRPSDSCT